MKIKIDEELRFGFFIFIIVAIVTMLITVELLRYSGYTEADSALVKKIQSLATLLEEANTHNEQLSKEVISLEKEIFELKHGLSGNGRSMQVKEMYQLAGFSNITGEGAIITIKEEDNTLNRQKDYANTLQSDDLLRFVNVLKASGATAISVNNQRLVVTSEITNADNNIIINKKKIAPPYTIKVLGDFDTISSALSMRGGMIEYLSLYNIEVDIQKQDKITINAY